MDLDANEIAYLVDNHDHATLLIAAQVRLRLEGDDETADLIHLVFLTREADAVLRREQARIREAEATAKLGKAIAKAAACREELAAFLAKGKG